MIKIENKSLKPVANEYLTRLRNYGIAHPRSLVGQLLNRCSEKQFQNLILCPPEKLQSCMCPPGIRPSQVERAYHRFFSQKGEDGVNNAMWLINKLSVKVCPYCNRTYTFTVTKSRRTSGRNVRPELDHFFPKSNIAYKHLAISFYNLIPSCPLCNHLKGTTVCDYHPYYGHLISNNSDPIICVANTSVEGGLFPEKPIIEIKNKNLNTSTLALEELYSQHTDYVKEILDKMQAYNYSLYEPLIRSFQGIGYTSEDIDRIIWGNYVDEAHQISRPLSKLTIDILKQFDILK